MLVAKPIISKTIVKGTILILVFSSFLNFEKIISFLIFLLISFISLFAYAYWKKSHTYVFEDDGIRVKTPFNSSFVSYSDIDDAFISVGFLARKFNCGSIYIIKKNKQVVIIKDIPRVEEYFEILKRKVK